MRRWLRVVRERPGVKITFDAGEFSIDGQGPVTTDEIVESDRGGELVWPYDGMRAWVLSHAGAPPAIPVALESATTDGASAAIVLAGAASVVQPAPVWTASCPVCHGGSLLEGAPTPSFWGRPLPPDQLCPRCHVPESQDRSDHCRLELERRPHVFVKPLDITARDSQ